MVGYRQNEIKDSKYDIGKCISVILFSILMLSLIATIVMPIG